MIELWVATTARPLRCHPMLTSVGRSHRLALQQSQLPELVEIHRPRGLEIGPERIGRLCHAPNHPPRPGPVPRELPRSARSRIDDTVPPAAIPAPASHIFCAGSTTCWADPPWQLRVFPDAD